MTEKDAGQLLRQTSESLCVRYLHDQTGEIWFAEHFARRSSGRPSLGVKAAAAIALAATIPLLTQACGGAALDSDEKALDAGSDARKGDAGTDSPDGGQSDGGTVRVDP